MIKTMKKSVYNFFRKPQRSFQAQFLFVIKIVVVLAVLYFGFVVFYIWSLDCTKCPY